MAEMIDGGRTHTTNDSDGEMTAKTFHAHSDVKNELSKKWPQIYINESLPLGVCGARQRRDVFFWRADVANERMK